MQLTLAMPQIGPFLAFFKHRPGTNKSQLHRPERKMQSTSKCLVLALMACLATLVPRAFAAEAPPTNAAAKPKAAPAQPSDVTQETLKQMTAELKLTEDQQKSVKKTLDAGDQKMREIRADPKLTPQEFGTKGREVRAATDKRLKEILTADQYQKWQKFLAQRGTRRRAETPPDAAPLPKQSSPPAPAR